MKRLSEMSFQVTVRCAGTAEDVVAFLSQPKLLPNYPGSWTCLYGWRGNGSVEGAAFGATSLGALQNAITILEARLLVEFPHSELLEGQLPFVFTDAP